MTLPESSLHGSKAQGARPRVAILMFSTPRILAYASLAAEVNKRYADRHGYDFIHEIHPTEIAVPRWEIVRVLRETLARYEAVVSIVSEAIFSTQRISLDFLLNDGAELAECQDHPNGPYLLNAGVLFIKNTPWARELVDRWWALQLDPKYEKGSHSVRAAMDALLRAESPQRFRVHAATAFNSIENEIKTGRRDTFVLNFKNMQHDARRLELLRWLRENDVENRVALSQAQDTQSTRDTHRSRRNAQVENLAKLVRSIETRRAIAGWLVYGADPIDARTVLPRRSLTPEEARQFVIEAEAHGVLPSVLRKFPHFTDDPAYEAVRADAAERLRMRHAFSVMLCCHGEALLAKLSDLPIAMVKGPVFARTIYPSPALRPFTDIDLLAAPAAVEKLEPILRAEGFELSVDSLAPARREWKWVHRVNKVLIVEVHANLVHAPSLQRALSFSYDDLAAFGPESPASLLAVAVIHGALHQFERLRQVVDVCQAARGIKTDDEERRFLEFMVRSGGRLAAAAGLALAHRLFAEPRCLEIAKALGPVPYAGVAALLMRRFAVTSSMNSSRVCHSWRRHGLRELLKRGRLPRPDNDEPALIAT